MENLDLLIVVAGAVGAAALVAFKTRLAALAREARVAYVAAGAVVGAALGALAAEVADKL
jgi:hypothetical protein